MNMPADYVTKEEFGAAFGRVWQEFAALEKRLDVKIHAAMTEQRIEFQNYIAVLAEDFQSRLQAVSEGVMMNFEKAGRLEGWANSVEKEIQEYDRRLSYIEMSKARKRKKSDTKKKTRKKNDL